MTTISNGKTKQKKKGSNEDRNTTVFKKPRTNPPLFEVIDQIIKDQTTSQSRKNQQNKLRTSVSSMGKRETASTANSTTQNNQQDPGYHSSGSSSSSGVGNQQPAQNSNNESDEENENEFDNNENKDVSENEEPENEEINVTVQNSSSEDTNTDVKDNTTKPKTGYQSFLSPQLKSSLQWYARNQLFQQIKIIDESHLEASGQIMQDALDKLKIDKSSKHFNAYVNDCRRIIKRAMCSRRGYVKHEIGLKLKSK
jgi:hypothetical protein